MLAVTGYQMLSIVFAGDHCQDYDGCASNPCEHGGTCRARYFSDTYTCRCEDDYSGRYFQHFIPNRQT